MDGWIRLNSIILSVYIKVNDIAESARGSKLKSSFVTWQIY